MLDHDEARRPGRPGTLSSKWAGSTTLRIPGHVPSYQILDVGAAFTPDGLNTDGYAYCPKCLAAQGECTQDGSMRFNTTKDPRTTMFSTGSQAVRLSVRGGTEIIRYYVSGQLEKRRVIDYNTLDKANFRQPRCVSRRRRIVRVVRLHGRGARPS